MPHQKRGELKELDYDPIGLVDIYGSVSAAAKAIDMPRSTFSDDYNKALHLQNTVKSTKKPFKTAEVPHDDLTTEELIRQRKKQFQRKREAHETKKLWRVDIQIDGPIGIVHFGDPHVDDDGTDIGLLEEHVRIVDRTDGLFGANLGDLQNNWVGRLARLWAEQGTSAKQAWQLVKWLCGSIDWLYMVGGNHDAWSGTGDPLQWIMKQTGTAYDNHGVRLGLHFPNKRIIRINARHDFTGHSMWNPLHGPMKAVQMGWRDHILTCGHKHESFTAGPLKDPATGQLSWAIRCAGYKSIDRYAGEKGLPDQNAFAAAVTIIDPRYDDNDTRQVTVIPDVHEGAEFLKWKRRKAT